MDKVVHNECESLSAFYFGYFKEPNALFSPVLLKVNFGRFDGLLVVEPLLTCDASPSVTYSLLCEGYTVTFRLAENLLPNLSIRIQYL